MYASHSDLDVGQRTERWFLLMWVMSQSGVHWCWFLAFGDVVVITVWSWECCSRFFAKLSNALRFCH